MNKKIKILGLSAFIATGMAPLGSTKVFADEANPTQIEEQLDIDENSKIEEQESEDNQKIESTNENEDISSDEEQDIDEHDVEKDSEEQNIDKYQDIDNNESYQFELIGKPYNSDIPKTFDEVIGEYIATMVAIIGGLSAVIIKMM